MTFRRSNRKPATHLERLEPRQLFSGNVGPLPTSAYSMLWLIEAENATGPLAGVSVQFAPIQGEQFNGTVARLVNYPADPSNLSASINWGDPSTPDPVDPSTSNVTVGTIVLNPDGSVSVTGSHQYRTSGFFTVTVSITRPTGATTTANVVPAIQSLAVVNPHGLTGSQFLVETANHQFTDQLGSFPFDNPNLFLSGTVNWGDGSPTTDAILRRNDDGTVGVFGTHTYDKKTDLTKVTGYTATVTIKSNIQGQNPGTPINVAAGTGPDPTNPTSTIPSAAVTTAPALLTTVIRVLRDPG